MARSSPKEKGEAREGKKHEIGEKAAFEKAEKEDKSLHKVVTKAMKRIGKK
jgi:hypothetical protein